MFKRFPVLIASAVIMALALSACAAPSPTPAPTSVPTTAPTAEPTAVPTVAPTTAAPGSSSYSSGSSTIQNQATLNETQNTKLGMILSNNQGMTLYTYKKDTPGVSNCTGQCATLWPPLTVAQGVTPIAEKGIAGTVATIKRQDGTLQVTYNNAPLYLYSGDKKAGDTNGNGIANLWSVVTVSAPAASVPDFATLGFPTTLVSKDITPGTATTITAGPYTIDIPADAFTTPVTFQVLTGDLARFLAQAPTGEQPVLDFALRVQDTQTKQLIAKFNKPVTFTATSSDITANSKYYNIAPDGAYTENATGMQVSAGKLSHPIAGAPVGWVITSPEPTVTSGKVALLLPESKTTRYEAHDRPDFETEFKKLCPTCQILYSNANQDANLQLSQAQAALTNGAQVLVLDPVDSAAAATIADQAAAQGVPVIAYDRLILNSTGVKYYISFDNQRVGQLQAQNLMNRLSTLGIKNPSIVMINGAPTDNNAAQFKAGAHSVFDPLVKAGKLTIAKEYDTPDWSPNQAQNEMQQALTALSNKVDGVYAANDGTAGGAIAAMKTAGLSPLPPITGQDAELAAIQRILTGEQYMTVYKAIQPEAYAAAQIAYDLMAKSTVPAMMTNGKTTNNGKTDVPSILLTPVAVTKSNIGSTVVKDGFWTVQQICTTQYAAACKAAGLQ